jgi:2-C-methyl-D-erythritol 2,4-cyclodiphosphate synthase
MRVGIGYDVHKLISGRPLIIGGVQIPFDRGLLGHSDADVLVHAIMDALLGAARQGDIGQHFPDNDKEYEGISSILLLRRVYEIICEKGFHVSNIDAVIIAQAPKMAFYFETMINNISQALDISSEQINIKATTTEGLGFEGQGLGIAAYAVVLLN